MLDLLFTFCIVIFLLLSLALLAGFEKIRG